MCSGTRLEGKSNRLIRGWLFEGIGSVQGRLLGDRESTSPQPVSSPARCTTERNENHGYKEVLGCDGNGST